MKTCAGLESAPSVVICGKHNMSGVFFSDSQTTVSTASFHPNFSRAGGIFQDTEGYLNVYNALALSSENLRKDQ